MRQLGILALVSTTLLLTTGAIARERVPQINPAPVQSGGAVPIIQSQVQKQDAKYWLLFGKVHNQTGRTIKSAVLTLEITSGKRAGQMINLKIHPNVLTPDKNGGFQATVSSPNQQPNFKLVSVQWRYEDNTIGIYP
ncbi:MAG: hypothetical protein WCA35_14310 [Kovacikia sp.]